jgi:hypothetical protein
LICRQKEANKTLREKKYGPGLFLNMARIMVAESVAAVGY